MTFENNIRNNSTVQWNKILISISSFDLSCSEFVTLNYLFYLKACFELLFTRLFVHLAIIRWNNLRTSRGQQWIIKRFMHTTHVLESCAHINICKIRCAWKIRSHILIKFA